MVQETLIGSSTHPRLSLTTATIPVETTSHKPDYLRIDLKKKSTMILSYQRTTRRFLRIAGRKMDTYRAQELQANGNVKKPQKVRVINGENIDDINRKLDTRTPSKQNALRKNRARTNAYKFVYDLSHIYNQEGPETSSFILEGQRILYQHILHNIETNVSPYDEITVHMIQRKTMDRNARFGFQVDFARYAPPKKQKVETYANAKAEAKAKQKEEGEYLSRVHTRILALPGELTDTHTGERLPYTFLQIREPGRELAGFPTYGMQYLIDAQGEIYNTNGQRNSVITASDGRGIVNPAADFLHLDFRDRQRFIRLIEHVKSSLIGWVDANHLTPEQEAYAQVTLESLERALQRHIGVEFTTTDITPTLAHARIKAAQQAYQEYYEKNENGQNLI